MQQDTNTWAKFLLANNPNAVALYCLDGQYLLSHTEDNAIKHRLISANSVRAAFINEPVDSGWLPINVLRLGTCSQGDYVISWHPPHICTLAIHTDQPRTVTVPLPGLVFFGLNNNYYIFAIKERDFSPDAISYIAPLPNINAQGKICFGLNDAPTVSTQNITKTWDLFIATPFNHDQSEGKSKKHKNAIALLDEIDKKRNFPINDLRLMSGKTFTINQAIERIIT